MSPDLLEDLLAFLYATEDEEKSSHPAEGSTCDQCGAELEYDEEQGEMVCPECDR